VDAGKLAALGITSGQRDDEMAKVPTIAEQGLKGYEALQWFAFFAPKGTPPVIVEKIQREMFKGLNKPAMREQLARQGARPGGNTPAEFATFLKEESDKWAAVAKAANIVPQ
jgi:tripartite-type tricarboxylate transporter receptor subunit TctC